MDNDTKIALAVVIGTILMSIVGLIVYAVVEVSKACT